LGRLIQWDGRKIDLGYPPMYAVESLTLAGRDKTYLWCWRSSERRRSDKHQKSERCADTI